MRWIYTLAIIATAGLLAACEIELPVVVIGKDGRVLKGTTVASSTGDGHFSVTDGKITCGGGYDSLDTSVTISTTVTCTDGRKGILVATRQRDGQSGSGHVTLNDGYTAEFLFGAAAAGF